LTQYVAVDVGKRKCVTCVMDQDGRISETSSYSNTAFDARKFAEYVVTRYGECKAVVESTGNMWLKTYEALESKGMEVKLANPLKTRAIAEAKVKTDKLDSKILAHLLRADLIAECYVPSRDVRLSRALLGHRVNVTREQTRIKNRIHSLLDKYDLESEYHEIFGAHGLRWLHTLQLNGHDQVILQSLLRQLEFLQDEEEKANGSIADDASHNPYVPVIMSMTGFDYYSASVLAAYIVDISRFPSPSHLVSWVGLCPSVHQTGSTLYMGKMKGGNKKVRWIMTQAANTAIRTDPRMQAYYERKLRRHHHNVAVTHVANKMLRILWYMLREKRLYNERKERLYQSKLKRMIHTAQTG
jgi:transposase